MGSPGLVDAVAIRAEVERKIGWLGRLFPILQRLLARAAEGEADDFAGSAPELATPWAFYLGDLLAPPLATPSASRFGDLLASPGLAQRAVEAPSPSSRFADSPQHLVRVSRVRPGGSAPSGSGDGVGIIAAGPVPPPAATPEISIAAATPAAALRIAQAHGGEAGVAAPAPLGRSPAPRSGMLSPLDRSEDRGSPAVSHAASLTAGSGPDAAPFAAAPSVRELGAPRAGRGVDATAELFSTRAAVPPAAGANEVPAAPRNVVPELHAPRAGRGVDAAAELFSARAAFPPATGANEAPAVRRSVVPELPAPRAGRGVEAAVELFSARAAVPPVTGANEAPLTRRSVVPELPARAPPGVPMVLPASFGEAPRRAAASPPPPPRARLTPVEPNPGVTVVPRPAIPPVAAIAGAELDQLAEKVSRIIARRVAVERERRGR
jgi:hypothetical protein